MNFQTHANQQELSALSLYIDKLKYSLNNNEQFNELHKKTRNYIFDLVQRNDIILTITRYNVNGNQVPSEIKAQWKECNVIAEIEKTVDTIEDSLEKLTDDSEKIKNITEKCLPFLRKEIESLANIFSIVIPAGLKLILLERLKNTIFFTEKANPVAEIRIEEFENDYHLIFSNNQTIDKGSYEQIKSGFFPKTSAGPYRTKIGERYIRTVIDYDFFCSERKWKIDITESSLNPELRKTEIYFIIPKRR